MSIYKAPLEEMNFVLYELADLDGISKFQSYADLTTPIVSAILNEASSMAEEVLSPLNGTGDAAGSKLVNGNVITPEGFDSAYKLFQESAWQSLPCCTEYGGQGLPHVLAAAVNEMWHSANASFALCPMLTESAIVLLEKHGSNKINDIYLKELISGNWTGTMALTEPQAGSDLSLIKTQAVPDGDHYLLTGQKIFITWGDHDLTENILHFVLARLPDAPEGIKGLSLFLVPKILVNKDGSLAKSNDIKVVSLEKKMGIHASPTCVLSFGDNNGAIGYLIGNENEGISCMFTMMNHARLAVGLQSMAISEMSFQQALFYARDRKQGTDVNRQNIVPITYHPDVRRMLMLIKSCTEAMRALCYMVAATLDHANYDENLKTRQECQEDYLLLTPIVKGWCAELSIELTSIGIQVHGGTGYIEETGAAQYFRDARITSIYEGTTGIQARDLVERKVIRDKGRVLFRFIDDMRATIAVLQNSNNEDLRIINKYFDDGISNLDSATRWILDNHKKDTRNTAATAYNYLLLAGTVFGGWQMARASLASIIIIKESAETPASNDFYRNKIITARFYAEHILTRSRYYLQTIFSGNESIQKLNMDNL